MRKNWLTDSQMLSSWISVRDYTTEVGIKKKLKITTISNTLSAKKIACIKKKNQVKASFITYLLAHIKVYFDENPSHLQILWTWSKKERCMHFYLWDGAIGFLFRKTAQRILLITLVQGTFPLSNNMTLG